MKAGNALLKNCMITAFWLCVWQGLSMLVGNPLLLPAPLVVVHRLWALMGTGSFWAMVGASLLRILCGTVVAVVLGTLLAVVCCRWQLVNDLFSPLLTIIKSTPVVSFIILLLIWVGRDILPAVVVILVVLPVIWGNVCAGIRNTDPLLLRTATVFHFPLLRKLRRVWIPSVMPHFLSACRTSLGLAWKSGIAAEVIAIVAGSIGEQLYSGKLYFESDALLGWTLLIVLISVAVERLFMLILTRTFARLERL